MLLLIFACYVDVYEPGKSSSSYYSDSPTSSPSSSSSRDIEPQDSLHCEEHSYKVVKMRSQIWTAQNLNEIPKSGNSWCHGDFNNRCLLYGRLYDWTAAMNVCPDGWRLPTKDDFDVLSEWDADDLRYTSVWHAAFGGFRNEDGSFTGGLGTGILGDEGYWWSSTAVGDRAYYYSLAKGGPKLKRYDAKKTMGFSVRCIKR